MAATLGPKATLHWRDDSGREHIADIMLTEPATLMTAQQFAREFDVIDSVSFSFAISKRDINYLMARQNLHNLRAQAKRKGRPGWKHIK